MSTDKTPEPSKVPSVDALGSLASQYTGTVIPGTSSRPFAALLVVSVMSGGSSRAIAPWPTFGDDDTLPAVPRVGNTSSPFAEWEDSSLPYIVEGRTKAEAIASARIALASVGSCLHTGFGVVVAVKNTDTGETFDPVIVRHPKTVFVRAERETEEAKDSRTIGAIVTVVSPRTLPRFVPAKKTRLIEGK